MTLELHSHPHSPCAKSKIVVVVTSHPSVIRWDICVLTLPDDLLIRAQLPAISSGHSLQLALHGF